MTRRKLNYGIDKHVDIFVAPTWPTKFLEDPAYALLRPLYELTSSWRKSHEALSLYLHSQARRLGGKRFVLFHLSNLSLISESYYEFNRFLKAPFDPTHRLKRVFGEMEKFLRWRFEDFKHDPWSDYPLQEKLATRCLDFDLTDEKRRKRLLRRELSKVPWPQPLQKILDRESGVEGYHTEIITKALKECPEISQKYNEDLVHHIFSSPCSSLTLELGTEGYCVSEIPIMIGSHYLGKNVLHDWFSKKGRKFYRIFGSYARWDNAKVVIFKHTLADDPNLFIAIKTNYKLRGVGIWKKAQVDGEDYYLSLLVDSDLPERSFLVTEWELNCPQLTILAKDTK
jgi:hypothetical protein